MGSERRAGRAAAGGNSSGGWRQTARLRQRGAHEAHVLLGPGSVHGGAPGARDRPQGDAGKGRGAVRPFQAAAAPATGAAWVGLGLGAAQSRKSSAHLGCKAASGGGCRAAAPAASSPCAALPVSFYKPVPYLGHSQEPCAPCRALPATSAARSERPGLAPCRRTPLQVRQVGRWQLGSPERGAGSCTTARPAAAAAQCSCRRSTARPPRNSPPQRWLPLRAAWRHWRSTWDCSSSSSSSSGAARTQRAAQRRLCRRTRAERPPAPPPSSRLQRRLRPWC